MRYAELQVTTQFSFLRGASSAQELFETAKTLGIDAVGVVDSNSLAGIVRALEASRGTGVRLVFGCRLDIADGMSVLVYPTDPPRRLLPADPAHHAWQVARRQEQLHPALG